MGGGLLEPNFGRVWAITSLCFQPWASWTLPDNPRTELFPVSMKTASVGSFSLSWFLKLCLNALPWSLQDMTPSLCSSRSHLGDDNLKKIRLILLLSGNSGTLRSWTRSRGTTPLSPLCPQGPRGTSDQHRFISSQHFF